MDQSSLSEPRSACPYNETGNGAGPWSVMSNYDREIDRDIEARLKVEKVFARYAGWNFNGRVWRCEVWVYGKPREVVEAETLEGIMEKVSEKWGSE